MALHCWRNWNATSARAIASLPLSGMPMALSQRKRCARSDNRVALLALGLEQAGAFISKMRCSFGGYLERRHAHEEKVRTRHDTRLMHYLFISRLELSHSPQHQLLTETNYSQFAAPLHWSISHLIHYRVMHDRSKGVNSASGATGCFLC
jgi:hypothetical protein